MWLNLLSICEARKSGKHDDGGIDATKLGGLLGFADLVVFQHHAFSGSAHHNDVS